VGAQSIFSSTLRAGEASLRLSSIQHKLVNAVQAGKG